MNEARLGNQVAHSLVARGYEAVGRRKVEAMSCSNTGSVRDMAIKKGVGKNGHAGRFG